MGMSNQEGKAKQSRSEQIRSDLGLVWFGSQCCYMYCEEDLRLAGTCKDVDRNSYG